MAMTSTAPTTTGPRIGMALYADATFDSRVRREAAALAEAGYAVTLVCLGDSGQGSDLPPGVQLVIRVPRAADVLPGVANPYVGGRPRGLGRVARPIRWLGGYARNLRAWGHLAVDAAGSVDAWHVHDFPALAAIGPLVGPDLPIVYDSHEIFMDAGTAGRLPGPARTLLRAYERRLVARASALVTVNDSLATVLNRRYRPRRTVVVHNCPGRWTPPEGSRDLLRAAAGLGPDVPVLLYHGNIGQSRGIDQLLEALLQPGLEQLHLVLLGPGTARETYAGVASDPRWVGRVHLLDAVPPDELLSWVASATVGGVLIQRTSLNHYLATPNKLFECIAAGVPVVASDFPTMERIVLDTSTGPLGAVSNPDDPAAVATSVRSILELDAAGAAELRARCRAAAHERWNWETESARLVELYRNLLPPPGTGR